MTNSGFNINAPGGTVVVSTGPNSAAQAGQNNQANTGQQSIDTESLKSLLAELEAAISSLASAKSQQKLLEHLQPAQTEATKTSDRDSGKIKTAIEAIKTGGEVIEGGEKIVELCSKLVPYLAALPALF